MAPDRATRRRRAVAAQLYDAAVAQARHPGFYTDLGVADTHDGRLELVQLHVILLLRRLQRGGDEGRALGQALFDAFFRDLDRSLREGGVGDLSVGKWVKKIGQQFYARATALEPALEHADAAALEDALGDNVYDGAAGTDDARRLAAYLLRVDAALAAQRRAGVALDALRLGDVDPIHPGPPATA
ncbi:MAG: ubiquinol-cytochrome C chaperone [Alphaproteobacteria bacterium]|nr:ubiquinol-cytochrome C chaperone [Alphaproteobacteria bacterium]